MTEGRQPQEKTANIDSAKEGAAGRVSLFQDTPSSFIKPSNQFIKNRLTLLSPQLNKKQVSSKVLNLLFDPTFEPQWGKAPHYLIPAITRTNIKSAPLYDYFHKAHQGRKTGTLAGLNERLRQFGKKLNCTLPIDRTDITTKNECSAKN